MIGEDILLAGVVELLAGRRASRLCSVRYGIEGMSIRMLVALSVLCRAKAIYYYEMPLILEMIGVSGGVAGKDHMNALRGLSGKGYIDLVERSGKWGDGAPRKCYTITGSGRRVVDYYQACLNAVWSARCRNLRVGSNDNDILDAGADMNPRLFRGINPEDIISAGEHKYECPDERPKRKRYTKK